MLAPAFAHRSMCMTPCHCTGEPAACAAPPACHSSRRIGLVALARLANDYSNHATPDVSCLSALTRRLD